MLTESARDATFPAPTDARTWRRRTLGLIAGVFLVRVAYAAWVPLTLVPDEAYYWDWSRQLDWGYFSKPPMVAWLIALVTALGGSTDFVVRLPAVVLGTASLGWMYLLGARLYGPRAGFWVVLLSAATPAAAALSLLMTIDAPFLFSWCAALYTFWRFLERGPGHRWWLLLATAAAGLGVLSKETMLGFLPLAGLFVLSGAAERRELRRPAFWSWAAGTLLFLAPVVWWNVRHDWITAQHSSTHFALESTSVLKRLAVCGEFLASQLGVASPVTAILWLWAGSAALRAVRHLERRERFLVCFSILPMIGVFGLSLLRRVQPNWPAGFYPAGMVLLVGWALGRIPALHPLPAGERALKRAAAVGVACTAITYLLPFGFGLEGTVFDPVVRLRGWDRLGAQVGQRLQELPERERTIVVVTTERQTTSELAFYLPTQPRVYLWNASGQIASQYDVWDGPREREGWNALLVTSADSPLPAELQAAFNRVESLGDLRVPIGAKRSLSYRLWHGVGWREWPTRRGKEGTKGTSARTRHTSLMSL
jgi:undecaprenyl-diphosphatase